jgi:nucleotide-binding universal stress UspA family protein
MLPTPGRVVVGVEDSLAGLRALRFAVAEARRRRAELHAVRTWTCSPNARGAFTAWYEELERAASDEIATAFDKAMGGAPDDIDVVMATVMGPPGKALVHYARREDDLLVLGATHGNRLWRLVRASVPRYCAAHAACPVLVVPPDAFAKQAQREGMARAIRRDLSNLTS